MQYALKKLLLLVGMLFITNSTITGMEQILFFNGM